MYRIFPRILAIVLLMASASYGQSLADAARQNRQQKSKNEATTKKVFTTDDISTASPPEPEEKKPEPYKKIDMSKMPPETWKRMIEAQKKWIAFLQSEADKLNASKDDPIDMKEVARDPKVRAKWEARGIQQQFASEIPEQKKNLEESQEAARKLGMPRAVWDP